MWVLLIAVPTLVFGALLGFVASAFLVYDPRSCKQQTIVDEMDEVWEDEETCEPYDGEITRHHKGV